MKFKAGLEIHVQLNTPEKLFCRCSTEMKEKDPLLVIKRKQHPVRSELGDIDVAAQFEFLRDRTFYYQVFKNETCLVEADCEPPQRLNQEALRIAIQIALLLNCKIVDEVHVMRKTLIDGSTTSGFQRTCIVGMNGYLSYKERKIPITHVSLEEDAASLVSEENGKVTYRLNRLGIPLVEIATGILENFSPKEIEEIAYRIGMICWSTGKTKRGLGSIRQDLNISIGDGRRVEVKGIQELSLLSKVIEYEVERQQSILKLREEFGRKRIEKNIQDVTKFFEESDSKLIRKIIEDGNRIFALKINGLAGLLNKKISPDKTLGKELSEYVKLFGVEGIIHTDEDLRGYGIHVEMAKIMDFLKSSRNDCIILVGEKTYGSVTEKLFEKIKKILVEGEAETRAANSDGSTRYMRPLPGAARLYPETDIPPVPIESHMLKEIKKSLPEPLPKKLVKFRKKFKLSNQLADQIIKSEYVYLFEKIVEEKKVSPSIVASTFVSILKDLKRRGNLDVSKLQDRHFLEVFDLVSRKKLLKEGIEDVLAYLCRNPEKSAKEAIEKLNLKPLKVKEIRKIVAELSEKNPGISREKLFGIVMSNVRGRADPKVVMKIIKTIL